MLKTKVLYTDTNFKN